jgi:hypothetical protein
MRGGREQREERDRGAGDWPPAMGGTKKAILSGDSLTDTLAPQSARYIVRAFLQSPATWASSQMCASRGSSEGSLCLYSAWKLHGDHGGMRGPAGAVRVSWRGSLSIAKMRR